MKAAKCEWDNTVEYDKCGKCGEVPDEMIYVETDPAHKSGVYLCRQCVVEIYGDDLEWDEGSDAVPLELGRV